MGWVSGKDSCFTLRLSLRALYEVVLVGIGGRDWVLEIAAAVATGQGGFELVFVEPQFLPLQGEGGGCGCCHTVAFVHTAWAVGQCSLF